MQHSKRHGLNKRKSAAGFRHDSHRTHPKNMKQKPMRGGWRL